MISSLNNKTRGMMMIIVVAASFLAKTASCTDVLKNSDGAEIPPGLQFANETRNSFVFTGWFRKESGDFHEDRKTTKVSMFDGKTFMWNPSNREWHTEDNKFFMNKEATEFEIADPQNGERLRSATKVEANQKSGSARRSHDVLAYQWQLHRGDSGNDNGLGDASTTDKVWIKLAPATTPVTKKPVNPSPGVIPAGLKLNGNSFVFTQWVGGKNSAEPVMQNLKFTWDESIQEWASENHYFMNRDATKFYRWSDETARDVVATKVSANQNSGSALRTVKQMTSDWQLHYLRPTEVVTIKADTSAPLPKRDSMEIATESEASDMDISSEANHIVEIEDIKPVNPSPVKMIAEVLKLDSDRNSFVFTEWINGKKNLWPEAEMKNIKFTWDEATKEWTNEEKSFYMNEEATKFYKGKATGNRQKVATKLSANQNSGSAPRTDEQMKYHWQLHDTSVTEIVKIRPTARRRLGASPVLCALMDEIAAQY